MIKVIAIMHIKPGTLEEVKPLCSELIALTRQEEGCIQYDLLQSLDDENQLTFQEDWASADDLKRHSTSAHFVRIFPQIGAYCDQETQILKYVQML